MALGPAQIGSLTGASHIQELPFFLFLSFRVVVNLCQYRERLFLFRLTVEIHDCLHSEHMCS